MAPSTTAPPSARSPCPPPSPSSATLPSRAAPSSPRSICPPPSKRSATSPSHAAGGNKVALTSATAGALEKPISALTRALGCPKLRPASRPISLAANQPLGQRVPATFRQRCSGETSGTRALAVPPSSRTACGSRAWLTRPAEPGESARAGTTSPTKRGNTQSEGRTTGAGSPNAGRPARAKQIPRARALHTKAVPMA